METIKTSGLIIYNDKGQILMQDRKSISKYGELRGFFGGHLEEGETFEQALQREIKEEIDVDLQNYEFFCKIIRQDAHNKGRFIETNSYMVKTDKQAQEFNVYEGNGCRFFYPAEVLELKTLSLTKHMAKMFGEDMNNL